MPIKFTIENRINITLALLAVFLLVLGTNRLDNQHFETVQEALKTVYKDRVVAQDYLFKMNTIVHQKRLHYQTNDTTVIDPNLNTDFSELTTLFYKTKLTTKERNTLETLVQDIEQYKEQEQRYQRLLAENPDVQPSATLFKTINELETSILKLSEIQVKETKRTIDLAQKSLDNTNMLANLEIWFLVVVGIAIQIAVFFRTSKSAKKSS